MFSNALSRDGRSLAASRSGVLSYALAVCLFAGVALAAPSRAFAATHAEKIDALIRSYSKLRQFNGSALVAEIERHADRPDLVAHVGAFARSLIPS